MRQSLETCEWLLSEMDMGLPHQRGLISFSISRIQISSFIGRLGKEKRMPRKMVETVTDARFIGGIV